MKKTILKVYSTAVMLNVWSMACLPLLVGGLAFAIFGTSNDPLWVIILSLSLVFFFLIFFAIEALYMTQRAEISEHGIAIYSIFFSTIKVIKWNELIDIRTQSIVTFSSAYGYHQPEYIEFTLPFQPAPADRGGYFACPHHPDRPRRPGSHRRGPAAEA